MTVRAALLQLLAEEERHGYQLKVDFEARTGGIWPLNVGQVYSTLERLVRDDRVSASDDADAAQKTYRITEEGRREVKDWLTSTPIDASPPRDELIMKVLLAVGAGGSEAVALIDEQRSAMLAELQRGRRQQRRRGEGEDVAQYLAHDALMTRIEADLAWLDRCEERIRAGMPGQEDDMTNDATALELIDVVKRYGSGDTEVRALTDVNLTVSPGEFVAVMGPSGSGKSTLLHLAGGLERSSAGRGTVAGADLDQLDAAGLAALRRRSVGFVFQRFNLVPTLTAVENVMLPLELDGVSIKRARAEAADALRLVDVDVPHGRYPDDLSGGQQQRVAIALAIVGDRTLLLADEPTGALDSVTADMVIELMASLVTERNCALVLVTHEPRFASWADRIVRVRDGLLTEETRPSELGDEIEAVTR